MTNCLLVIIASTLIVIALNQAFKMDPSMGFVKGLLGIAMLICMLAPFVGLIALLLKIALELIEVR
jgi:hypothetical protein